MNNKNKDSRILKCQHVSLEVSDVNVSLEFYRKFLNMKLTERHRAGEHKDIPFEMAFLRLNKQHHDLVLTHNPNRKYTKKNDENSPAGIHHFAFECATRDSFLFYLSKAKEMNLKIVRGPVIHSSFHKNGDGTWGENESFYVLDPDNHRIEIFCDMAFIDKNGEYINSENLIVPDTIAEEI